jgi:hypothetical protein
MGKRGRPYVLDEGKRREILAILSVGCSQTLAARYVGCAPSTIRREAVRDPKFAERLQQAKCNAELSLVKHIRAAAKKEQYWRAAAWALERGFPDKYARRGPDVITADQLAQILAEIAESIVNRVPIPEYRKNIVKDIESAMRSLGYTVQKPKCEETADDSD